MNFAASSPFLLRPSGRESNRIPPEQTESLLLEGEDLVREVDLARCLLDLFWQMRPGGLLRIRLALRAADSRPLTTWTEIVAELVFPHLADLRQGGSLGGCQAGPAWYSLSPATLRAFVRKLFGDRLVFLPAPGLEPSENLTSGGVTSLASQGNQASQGSSVLLTWRKSLSLASAFPWRIGEGLPEMLVEPCCAREGAALRVRVAAPYKKPLPAPNAGLEVGLGAGLDVGLGANQGKGPESGDEAPESCGKGPEICDDAPGEAVALAQSPSLSVIMASLNVRSVLPKALRALAAQTRPPLELVVQDGGSTDGTQACLEAWAQELSFPIRLESRGDRGVYEAWNRALDRVRGQWLLFLGADDSLLDDVLASALPLLQGLDKRIELAYGGLELCRAGKRATVWDPHVAEALVRMRRGMALPFPATFIRASLFKKRRFDPSYRIAGDFRLMGELARPDNLARLPLCVTRMELGGLSSNPKYHTVTEAERIRVLRELAFLP